MSETRYYRNCDELSVYNFHKVLETNNYSYLIVGFDDYKEVKFDEKEADELWGNIYEEYCRLTKNNKSLLYFAIFQELLYLRTRYQVARILLMQLSNSNNKEEFVLDCIERLREWKYKIDKEKPLKDELARMIHQLKVSENKIQIKQSELEDLKVDEGEKLSLIEQNVKLELALGKNKINTKKTSVSEHVALFNEVHLLNEARRKQNNK
jgi:hypothetical protein